MSNPYYSNSMQQPLSDDILRKLILLYGFNFELQQKFKNRSHPLSSNSTETYYAINSEWISTFKDFYNYKGVSDLIIKYNNFNCNTYN